MSLVDTLKYEALLYLRFNPRCELIATEASRFNADVMGSNYKNIYEIEVKISKSDLFADSKKPKHLTYSQPLTRIRPNIFYYLVPISLMDDALEAIEKLNKHYGLLVYRGETKLDGWSLGSSLSVAKKPFKLYKGYSEKLEEEIKRRMSVEYLVLLRERMRKNVNL